ncbi:MAG: hypothetical protein OXC40_05305, partial [Proteobacteria bacterium]|nr:hypothetical protein [Pseudomonadota bacterium]
LFESAEPLVSSWQGQSEDMEIKVTELMTHYQRLKLTDEHKKVIRDFVQLSSDFELSMTKLRLFEKHFLRHNSLYWLLYLQVFAEVNKDIPSLLASYHPSIIAEITMQMKKALQLIFDSHDLVLYLNSHVDIFEYLSRQITIEDTLSLDELTRYLELFNDREIYGRLHQQMYDTPQLKLETEVMPTRATMATELDTSAVMDLQNYLDKFKQEPLDLHIFLSLILKLDQTSVMMIANTYGVTRDQVTRRMDQMKNRLFKEVLHVDDHDFRPQVREINWGSSVPSDISDLYESFTLADMIANIKKSKFLKKYVAVGLPYLTEDKYQRFEEEGLTNHFEKHVFISYLLGLDNLSSADFIRKYDLGYPIKFFRLHTLVQYKFFYFFHSGQLFLSHNFQTFQEEYKFLHSYYENITGQLPNNDSKNQHRELHWASSVPSDISNLYGLYTLADMVANIKKSHSLKKFLAVGLPYLTEDGYQRFEEQVLKTPFDKHVFINHLLAINKVSYLDFVRRYNISSAKFFQLVNLLKYKFFYFFHSGKIPSDDDFPNFKNEFDFFQSYYKRKTSQLPEDEATDTESNHNTRLQNQVRKINWGSSFPSEISDLYSYFTVADMLEQIESAKKLEEYVKVGLPYLNAEKYQIFEEKVLTTLFEKHVFISYLLGVDNLKRKDFSQIYNLGHHSKFTKLLRLLQYKFFYFFYSGELPSYHDFPTFKDEFEFFQSYYQRETSQLSEDEATDAELDHNTRLQNQVRKINWGSSFPSEISELYGYFTVSDMLEQIKSAKKLKEYIRVGLPHLNAEKYQIFED